MLYSQRFFISTPINRRYLSVFDDIKSVSAHKYVVEVVPAENLAGANGRETCPSD